ncbi:HipA N-terminal domain-containing protein [Christiangramia sp. OXR-203]|uniref:HipA N-terminal domain-containing protein n=1 Tax=Christiangramia sp. OXR-203 TaxID=3100176 RepID=UPI002AC8E392|nr:HipA N-terminal domain-containing protein [Christiangramia sp. OXR-203]WPY99839.1 HipA N-terminal domain-containing protein [Christiangramia sp. OXR-203]
MRQAAIYYKGEKAGILKQHDDGSFTFRYLEMWLSDPQNPSISLTLPRSQPVYHSKYLFPFFYNMLPEGTNRQKVCKAKRLDTDDYFGILMTTARYDTVGAITVEKIKESV